MADYIETQIFKYGSLDEIINLIYRGVSINKKYMLGFTPLNFSLGSNTVDVIDFLIENGAMIGSEARSTPLHFLLDFGHNNENYIIKCTR